MARRPFGGTTADIAQDTAGDRVAGAIVTIWTAVTGGTQLTDLQTPAAVAIPDGEVTSDSNGVISFLGPDDGTSVVFADGGLGGRTKMLSTDLADRVEVLEDNPGGGGAVDSVNGQTGVVVLDAADVGADAAGAAAAAQAAAVQRANHTGTQAISTVTGLQTALDGKADDADIAALSGTYQPLDPDLTTFAGLDSSTAGVVASEGAGWVRRTYAQVKTSLGLVKGDVGLGNVDNTADTAKPVSTAQQTALDLKANLASPALTGNPTAPTQTAADNSTKLATTAYVDTADGLLIPKSIVDAAGDLITATADNTPARLAKGTALQVLRVNSGATALEWATPSGGAAARQVHMNPLATPLSSTGTWGRSQDNAQIFAARRILFPAADLNEIVWPSGLSAGTWTLDFFSRTGTGFGKADVAVSYDGTNWTTVASGIDMYAASGGHLFSTTTAISITGDTPQVRVKINGKNGSSSDYQAQINWLTWTRTA